jgi:hypothetical protein
VEFEGSERQIPGPRNTNLMLRQCCEMQNRSTNLCNEFVQSYALESHVNKKGLASHPGQPPLLKCELNTD